MNAVTSVSGNASTSPNQRAIAASYAAVVPEPLPPFRYHPDPARTGSLFENSIPIGNMHDLEWLAYYIDPPRWPAAIFGAIKPDLAAAGERLFRGQCAGCHEYGDDRRTPTGLITLRDILKRKGIGPAR